MTVSGRRREMAGDQRSPLWRGRNVGARRRATKGRPYGRGRGGGTRRERPFAPDRSADGLSRAPAPTAWTGRRRGMTQGPPCLKGGAPVRKLGRGDTACDHPILSPSHARRLARQPPDGRPRGRATVGRPYGFGSRVFGAFAAWFALFASKRSSSYMNKLKFSKEARPEMSPSWISRHPSIDKRPETSSSGLGQRIQIPSCVWLQKKRLPSFL